MDEKPQNNPNEKPKKSLNSLIKSMKSTKHSNPKQIKFIKINEKQPEIKKNVDENIQDNLLGDALILSGMMD
jgi:hypothetical protein